MYEQIKTDKEATLDNGVKITPVATLADKSGGRCQISRDDHCYILSLKQANGKYKSTPYIFQEAFEVLKTLPPPFYSPESRNEALRAKSHTSKRKFTVAGLKKKNYRRRRPVKISPAIPKSMLNKVKMTSKKNKFFRGKN